MINSAEANFLSEWLRLNQEASDQWPANVIYDRITYMLRDGRLDVEEEKELLKLLVDVTGGDASRLNAHSLSSNLPISDPIPSVCIAGRRICITGKLLYGSRSKCREAIERRNGLFVDTVTRELNYLVIGVIGSRDWAHSSFGRKIQQAVEYRASGHDLNIVAEEHFLQALAS
jgi:NAD-dependent DNA ligase